MKKITYRIQFIILVAWIFVVIALFKLIPDKQTASVLAGFGFVLWPLIFLFQEFISRKERGLSWIHILGCGQFLILFAAPIFILRLTNWNREFSTLGFAGIPAEKMHQYSNYSYSVMLLAIVISIYRTRVRE